MLVRLEPNISPSFQIRKCILTKATCREWSGSVYSPLSQNPHQAWLISSVGNSLITIYNTASQSYLTAPAGTFSHSPAALSLHSHFLGLVSGPGSGGGATYGGVPGNPSDPHTQFTIIQNSDNSIRYACVFPPFSSSANKMTPRFQSNAYPTKLLDLANSGIENGTPVLIWETNGETGSGNQHWILTTE
jgi:hypothetical protein